ncbi:MAG: hypothetical protein BWZ10_01069 [candidate division BRC1 bacterium ADurb.BinA364]|nr:MAG: hypothetical protein BWZ10_01069 [candidate division BRC1 bacterium ADurb.BinA364]
MAGGAAGRTIGAGAEHLAPKGKIHENAFVSGCRVAAGQVGCRRRPLHLLGFRSSAARRNRPAAWRFAGRRRCRRNGLSRRLQSSVNGMDRDTAAAIQPAIDQGRRPGGLAAWRLRMPRARGGRRFERSLDQCSRGMVVEWRRRRIRHAGRLAARVRQIALLWGLQRCAASLERWPRRRAESDSSRRIRIALCDSPRSRIRRLCAVGKQWLAGRGLVARRRRDRDPRDRSMEGRFVQRQGLWPPARRRIANRAGEGGSQWGRHRLSAAGALSGCGFSLHSAEYGSQGRVDGFDEPVLAGLRQASGGIDRRRELRDRVSKPVLPESSHRGGRPRRLAALFSAPSPHSGQLLFHDRGNRAAISRTTWPAQPHGVQCRGAAQRQEFRSLRLRHLCEQLRRARYERQGGRGGSQSAALRRARIQHRKHRPSDIRGELHKRRQFAGHWQRYHHVLEHILPAYLFRAKPLAADVWRGSRNDDPGRRRRRLFRRGLRR